MRTKDTSYIKNLSLEAKTNALWIFQNDWETRNELTKIFVLSNTAVKEKTDKLKKAAFVQTLVKGKYSGLLSGTNNFDNIWWFNKEISDYSLNLFTALKLLAAKKSAEENIFTMYKDLSKAKTKAAYKCELLLKQFEVKSEKKTGVKALGKVKAAATGKKAGAKKTVSEQKTGAKKAGSKKTAGEKKTGSKKPAGKKSI